MFDERPNPSRPTTLLRSLRRRLVAIRRLPAEPKLPELRNRRDETRREHTYAASLSSASWVWRRRRRREGLARRVPAAEQSRAFQRVAAFQLQRSSVLPSHLLCLPFHSSTSAPAPSPPLRPPFALRPPSAARLHVCTPARLLPVARRPPTSPSPSHLTRIHHPSPSTSTQHPRRPPSPPSPPLLLLPLLLPLPPRHCYRHHCGPHPFARCRCPPASEGASPVASCALTVVSRLD